MEWEILHIPEKQKFSLEESTVEVIASKVEPKLANSLVRQLNQICPLEDLRHVKRVRRRSIEGKIELSVILCFSQEHVDHVDGIPNDALQLMSAYQLSPFNAKVAKFPAASKEEWEEQCKLWPTSYHPPTNNHDAICGFTEEDSKSILNHMKDAIRLAKIFFLCDKVVNAALIIDSSSKEVIASGTDQTFPRSIPADTTSSNCSCTQQGAAVISPHSDANGLDLLPKSPLDMSSQRYSAVSCLYPWAWTEQTHCSQNSMVEYCGDFSWHPLRHAALVAIDNASVRDRKLFPGLGSSADQSAHRDDFQPPSDGLPTKRQKIDIFKNGDSSLVDACPNGLTLEPMRPYLCTGFDIYLVWEPCTMCAMALVHQRIRRIFYAFPNPNLGALGSVYRLQGERSLNHHYSVFRIMVPESILREIESH